ncbi:hypothetical protein [uncultured Sulfitobacter sp.]|uniref:hypothetical protein n=1 Tax=uncultured Sulfitobacter sp. TaxID=191468 RepID=UPI0026186295|nr:hypothetical protein [uncultured Sulfitobacter sp.]
MKTNRPSGSNIAKSLRRVTELSLIWYAMFVPATMLYLAQLASFVSETKGASSLLGLNPTSAEAVLLDLLTASLPMITAFAIYLRVLAQRRKKLRISFVAQHMEDDLVYLPTYPALIYRRSGAQIQVLWNADGFVAGGPIYPVPSDITLRAFDPDHFIADGTP